jgi:uncharacterized protein (TIGR03083 family)
MSLAGLNGMQLATADILTVARNLKDQEWNQPSAAKGWSVHDVVAHAGNLLSTVVDAVNGQLVSDGMGIEALNDVRVEKTRTLSSPETIEFVETQLAKALPLFTALQDAPLATSEAQLLDLGSYPLHSIVDMFTFDFTTHLRLDILAPRGPIRREVEPLDEAHLTPAVSWLLGGIPKMQTELWKELDGPVGLVLTGPAATSVVLRPADELIAVDAAEADTDVRATIHSRTADFLAWSTTRLPWRSLVEIDGDEAVAARFLDALNLT